MMHAGRPDLKPDRILVVDDDPDARNLLAIALSTVAGFDVLICGSARDAVAALDRFTPDLVLLDDRMPIADGEQTLQMLRARSGDPSLPVIYLTAMAHRKNVDRLLASGAISVIGKPFDPMTLGTDIREICRQAPPEHDYSPADR